MRSKQSFLPGWLSLLLSGAFILSSLAVLFFAFLTVQHMLNKPINEAEAAGSDDPFLSGLGGALPPAVSVIAGATPLPTPLPTPAAWEGTDRVNILLMGIDRRPGEAFISRTDSIMVISVDPVTESASILSIPRDLYAQIPGYGQDRINTAFVYGAIQNGDYLDGAALSMQTVAYNLGIPIHHFVLVDFGAFTRSIDLLGGLDINVPYAINDPNYPDMDYGYDPLYIAAGQQHMDGATALKYARTRHADTDFNRAERQQQVLLAARNKALNLGFTELLRRLPSLYAEVQQGIRTDLSLEQLARLAKTVGDIPADSIRSEVLDYDYVSSYQTPGGASVLVMSPERVQPMIQSLFGN